MYRHIVNGVSVYFDDHGNQLNLSEETDEVVTDEVVTDEVVTDEVVIPSKRWRKSK